MNDFAFLKEQICGVCSRMWQQGWVASNNGNVSAKLSDGTFLITPSGISKELVTPETILHIDKSGNILDEPPDYKPSSEMWMHLKCYEIRPDAGGVVHAHPPGATAFAAARRPLNFYNTVESVLNFGIVPVSEYAPPGSTVAADAIAPLLPAYNAILLANHGAIAIGKSVLASYYKMESLELMAKTELNILALGGGVRLNNAQIDEIIALRKKYVK